MSPSKPFPPLRQELENMEMKPRDMIDVQLHVVHYSRKV
jgi:hypothetical protein